MPNETEAPIHAISATKAKLRLERQAVNRYRVTIPYDTQPEELLQPEFWKHLASLLKKDWVNFGAAEIRAECEDLSWHWELIVRDVGPYHVTLLPAGRIWRYGDDCGVQTAEPAQVPDGYRILYAPSIGYWVRRLADKQKIGEGFKSKPEAKRWLDDHLEKLAA